MDSGSMGGDQAEGFKVGGGGNRMSPQGRKGDIQGGGIVGHSDH
jgi:hypothetical protein